MAQIVKNSTVKMPVQHFIDFFQSAWPCGLNTARFVAVPGSKRNPCERWQGASLISVLDLIGCETEKSIIMLRAILPGKKFLYIILRDKTKFDTSHNFASGFVLTR